MQLNIFKIRAFTLIEVMVAIAVASIILAIAVPAYTALIQNNYSNNTARTLVAALKFSRSEAVKRNSSVSICATNDANFTSCGSQWTLGWIIFLDPNGNGTLDSGETILRTEPLTGNNASIALSTSGNSLTYGSTGFPASSTSNITINVYATGCVGNNKNTIAISVTGVVSTTQSACP